MGGELVTASFWDSLAGEVDMLLQEAGQLAAPDLAMRFNVGLELLMDVLKARLGKQVTFRCAGKETLHGCVMSADCNASHLPWYATSRSYVGFVTQCVRRTSAVVT